MTRNSPLDHETTGGAALTAGFLVVAVLLYRDPASGLDAATATTGSAAYFLVLPTAGLLAGVYVVASGRFAAPLLFAFGSYLGTLGLAVALSGLLAAGPSVVVTTVGATVVVLALVAVVAGMGLAAAPLGVAVDAALSR